jgi:hypothetical protein
MTFAYKLELEDGTPADPPTMRGAPRRVLGAGRHDPAGPAERWLFSPCGPAMMRIRCPSWSCPQEPSSGQPGGLASNAEAGKRYSAPGRSFAAGPLPCLPRLGGLANAGLFDLLFWRRFEVLKDFAEKKECRRPQTHKDGEPLSPCLRVSVGNRCRSSPEREAARDRGSAQAVQERTRQPQPLQ